MKRNMQCILICAGIAVVIVSVTGCLLNAARYIDIRLPEIDGSSGWLPVEYVCLKYSDHFLDHAWIVRKHTAMRSDQAKQQVWDEVFPKINAAIMADGWRLSQDAMRTTPYFPQSEFIPFGPGGYVKYHRQVQGDEYRDLPSVAYVGVWSVTNNIWEISVVTARPSLMARVWNKF